MTTYAVRLTSFALLCCGWAASAAHAQELTWAQKMFDHQAVDFGVVARGSDAVMRIKVTNLYKEQVHIQNVRTTCGCSAATPSKTTLESREVAYVDVTMNTERFTHRKDSNVIITIDAPLFEEVRIPITAYIRTDVVLTPGSAKFGAIDVGKPSEKTLSVAYAGRDDWHIREVKSLNPNIVAEVKELSRTPGRVNYELKVKVGENVPAGDLHDQIVLLTDDAKNPEVPVLVEARVEADITITPSLVSLGNLTPGQTKTVNVVVKGKKPFSIDKIECESDREAFQVRLPKTESLVHVLPLTVTTPETPGRLDEEFTMTIAGRAEPVKFKAYGRVVEAQASTSSPK